MARVLPLRTPGTLAEVFVKTVKDSREELLEDETQRLSTALMCALPGGSSSSFQASVVAFTFVSLKSGLVLSMFVPSPDFSRWQNACGRNDRGPLRVYHAARATIR